MLMFKVYLCFVFILTNVTNCKSSNGNYNETEEYKDYVPRVVNGWPSKLGDVPYQIAFKTAIQHSRIYGTFCGGVITSPTKLLSAAHCFSDSKNICQRLCSDGAGNKRSLSKIYAVAGNLRNRGYYNQFDTDGDGQWRKIKSAVYPSNYKFPKADIAVVMTHKPFVFNNYINSVPIASKLRDYIGQCLVSGYGRISTKYTSDKLLLAHLDLIPMTKCNRMHRRNMRNFICTSSIVADVGKGDSGGPLVCANTGDPNELGGKGILVGIVSGNRHNVGSFFTRVSSFYKYIENNKCSKHTLDTALFTFIITMEINLLPLCLFITTN